MATANFIPRLRHFYFGQGTAGLIDQVASANFVEQGTVGLNSADGPPPEPGGTSRGPCDSTTTGFARSPITDFWDIRGAVERTCLMWCRFDSFSTDQEAMAWWTGTAAAQGMLFRYEHAFQRMVIHARGTTNNADFIVGPVIDTAGAWNLVGWSLGADGELYGHSNGVTVQSDGGTFGGFSHTTLTPVRIGVTVTGVSGSGLKGDVAYLNMFDFGFTEADWAYFWNNSNGQPYPRGYLRPPQGWQYYWGGRT